MTAMLGVIADDVTGACDLADAVREAGARVTVCFGVPADDAPASGSDCVVVALRTRTAPRSAAVTASTAAARWLLGHGATALYQKYCSTFDSTDDGMIGPVADALCALLGDGAGSIGTPATPRSGRTQYQGHLFVEDRLLSESPMRHHPRTPMRDADLVAVLSRQSRLPVRLVSWQHVAAGRRALDAALQERLGAGGPAHLLVDALTDADLDALARAVPRRRTTLLGGAAGFAAALARRWAAGRPPAAAGALPPTPAGRSLIVSGSCSARTRHQIAAFAGPRVDLDPLAVAADPDAAVDAALRAIAAAPEGTPVLVSSSAEPSEVARAQAALGADRAARLLETAAGRIAGTAVRLLNVRRLLVAGGETSGAVVDALDPGPLAIGPAASPGVPWMVPEHGPRIALLLKSGNFGPVDLFTTAWDTCP